MMKQKILIAVILAANYCANAAKVDKNVDFKQPITPSFYAGVIHLSDLDTSASAGGAMYTIQASGRYYVANDLSLNPSNNRVAAIKVSASNVFLDLNDVTIFQRTGNSATGLMGIEVDSSVANVQILNGKINGLTVSDSTEQNAAVVVQSSANNIVIEDIYVSGCTSATKEVAGFLLSSCNNVKIINCESSSNTNTLASATDDDGTVSGFKLSSCNSCTLQNCVANRNDSTDQSSYGFYLSASNYNSIIDCRAINQISQSGDGGDVASGYYVIGGGVGNYFDRCVALGNTGGSNTNSIGAGFYIDADAYTTVTNCVFTANSGGSGDAYGIFVGASAADCNFSKNLVYSNYGSDSCVGINDAGSANSMFVSNFAHGNKKTTGGTYDNYSGSIGEISTATHADYTNLDSSATGYNNLEIVG